jgi:hypothetical protein
MADGTEQELPIGFGVIELEGLTAGGTLVFAGETEEPLLGVTVLESTGLWIDPRNEKTHSPHSQTKRAWQEQALARCASKAGASLGRQRLRH